jgi:hypothetical protein
MPWELAGNSGTNAATQFLGTTDNQPLVIRTNGKEVLRVDTKSNVGIGTAAPVARLHVDGGLNDQWGMILSSPGGSAYGLKINHGWFGNDIPIFQANALDGTREVPRLVIKANGRVGIGTTGPTAQLHVVGPVRADSATTAAGVYDEFVAGIAPAYDFRSESNRELRIQSFNDEASYHQFLLYNGRISGGTLASPASRPGSFHWDAFNGVIPNGQDRVVELEFRPRSQSPVQATLTITSNTTRSPFSVRLSGRGIEAEPL